MKRNFLSKQDEQQLKLEIEHIFESGANEMRIFEMVKLFINLREERKHLFVPINTIDINYVKSLIEKIKEIDQLNLFEVSFVEDGKTIEIAKEIIEKFQFTGLSNMDFITTNFYKKKLT